MAKKELLKIENNYDSILSELSELLEQSRRLTARSVNAIMTATYWEIGRRIVEIEQKGEERAEYYGKEIVDRLAKDLTDKFGRGFGRSNLFQMRSFYLAYEKIVQTLSGQSQEIRQTGLPNLRKARHCPANHKRLCKHRLHNLLVSLKSANIFRFRGRIMSNCFRAAMKTSASFTKAKVCAAAGRFGS